MALIVPTSGDIAVDDISMCWRTGSGWWRHISHVSQNTFVNGGSFLENICFDKNQENIDQQRLDKIIEICELNEVVSQKEGGLEELLGENGSLLSGGQKQRVAIARALYSRKSLLVLDEATSAMDEKLECKILSSIRDAFQDLTIIVVTHRLSSLPECDKVFLVKDGHVALQR